MGLFGRVKIVVEGMSAEEAHSIMHQFDIEHHAFHNFNGLNLVEVGGFGLMAMGSHKVEIPLHGNAAKHPHDVVNLLRQQNPNWKVRVK